MSIGKLVDGCLECPFHGFRFAEDGACTKIPAHPNNPIRRRMALEPFLVREAHGLVFLWNGEAAEATDDIPFFDFEGYHCDGSEVLVPWDTHYSRSVENQLDFAHLAFVHASTIGRLATEVADGVVTEVDGDHITTWVDGQDGRLELIGPNLWRLRISPDLYQFLAMCPVDDERMVYVMRTYQRIVPWPGLRWLFGKLQVFTNQFVLRQDERVVVSQEPKIGDLQSGEVLVPSDRPIIEYRRWRERLRSPGRGREAVHELVG